MQSADSINTFSSEDFLPLKQVKESVINQNESLDYWQGSWKKLRANPRAMLSLIFIVSLVSFSLFGPLLWRVDPARQDLNQLSQAPSMNKQAIVVDTFISWQPENLFGDQGIKHLSILSPAHTSSVKLRWPINPEADYYEIYRHEYQPSGENDFGLPLAETSKEENFYEDRLNLEPQTYFYTVLARDGEGKLLAYETIETGLEIAVSKKDAEKHLQAGKWKKVSEHEGVLRVELSSHPMGTDYLGRDMMARLMEGGRTSLIIALIASLLFVAVGSLYGALAAYIGGQTDNIMMRFADFVIALPFLLFMILLKVSFGIRPGESGIGVMVFSLVILSWPGAARLIRSQVLVLREQNFILSARINGAGVLHILWKHLFPNVLSLILISLSFAIPSVILTEAFLSFIGLGVVPPTPSWGSMCQEGIKTFLFHPHELVFPSVFIGVTVLAFNLLGDGLRDAFDVKAE